MIKITRRNFLKGSAALGAAAAINGVVLNTLMPSTASADETAIIGWEPTTCIGCTTWCAVEVKTLTIADVKKAIDITGNRYAKKANTAPGGGDFGAACPRARMALMEAYDPDRVKTPMMRTNVLKGVGQDPEFVPVDIDTACDDIAVRMLDMRAATKAYEFAWFRGRYTINRDTTSNGLAQIYGTPNTMTHSSICAQAEEFARAICTGVAAYDDYDIDNCRYAILWGVDIVSSNRQISGMLGRLGKRMNDATNPMTVVSVDPRMNATGAKANYWLAPKPGTDGALALAMANRILTTGKWNKAFVGLDEATFISGSDNGAGGSVVATTPEKGTKGLVIWWNTVLKNCDPDSANFAGTGKTIYQITGITAATVKEIADGFSGKNNASITDTATDAQNMRGAVVSWLGPGVAMQPNGAYAGWAVLALNGLMGSFDHLGGEICAQKPSTTSSSSNPTAGSAYTDAFSSYTASKQKLYYYVQKNSTTSGRSYDLALPSMGGTTTMYAGKANGATARLGNCIKDESPYETKLIIGCMQNFAFSCVGAQTFEQGYSGDMSNWSATEHDDAPPFIVDLSTHASDTAKYADYVIPAKHAGLEVLSNTSQVASGGYHINSLYKPVISPVWPQAIDGETEFAWKLSEAMKNNGFSKLNDYYANAYHVAIQDEAQPTDATSFGITAAKYHGTAGTTTARKTLWAQLNTTYNPTFAATYGAGYGIVQTGYAAGAFDAQGATSTWRETVAGTSATKKYATKSNKIEFYDPSGGLAYGLSAHANAWATTVPAVLAACNYDRIAALAATDAKHAFMPNWEDPYIKDGGSNTGATNIYPFTLIDYKSRLNREGRSANISWYHDFKNCDPGDEKSSDVIKINPADIGLIAKENMLLPDSEYNQGLVRVTSPATTTEGVICKLKTWQGVRKGTAAKAFGQGHYAYGRNASKTMFSVANGGNNNELLSNEFERLCGGAARNANTNVKIVKVPNGTVVIK
jgi:anaerobic selenocysteine-containing dehydrogenase